MWYFSQYWYDSTTDLLQICQLHILDVNLPFHHNPVYIYIEYIVGTPVQLLCWLYVTNTDNQHDIQILQQYAYLYSR